jgi:hypothetical protein
MVISLNLGRDTLVLWVIGDFTTKQRFDNINYQSDDLDFLSDDKILRSAESGINAGCWVIISASQQAIRAGRLPVDH